MSQFLHAASVVTFAARLGALSTNLDKLAAHCEAKKIDPEAFLSARLYPDMLNLTEQVQLATDFANRASARLAGIDPMSLPDEETTIAQLQARIAKVVAAIQAIDPAQIEAGAERPCTFRTGPDSEATMPGAHYLIGFALPNFYFHVSMAYAILRHNGLEIGKRDFFGR